MKLSISKNLLTTKTHMSHISKVLIKIYAKTADAKIKNRYSICLVLSAIASILSIATPLITALIVKNIINNYNLKGIVPSLVAMVMIKGTRSFIRGRVNKLLLEVSPQTPLSKIRERVSEKLLFIEILNDKLGAFGRFITRVTGGVKIRVSAAAASLITDLVNIILSGAAFYFTQSYVLSVLVAFLIPTFAVIPLFPNKEVQKRVVAQSQRLRCYYFF